MEQLSQLEQVSQYLQVSEPVLVSESQQATSKATDAIARQPEADGKIRTSLILGCALAEATAIYGFIIALLIVLLLK